MTGPGLAPIIIPIAGTLCLTAWLALVFYAGHRPWRAESNPAPGQVIQVPAPARSREDLRAASRETADLRTLAEVQR